MKSIGFGNRLAVCALCALGVLSAFAAKECKWIGGSGNWSVASNWENGNVPEDGDRVVIDAGATAPCRAASFRAEQKTLRVLRGERSAFVRWTYRPGFDLVAEISMPANEQTHLLASDVPTAERWRKGMHIHNGGDDFAPTTFKDFGTLGGNHGSIHGQLHTVPGHGFTESDVGREIRHSSGETFRLVAIRDKDRILVHPDGHPGLDPKFRVFTDGTFTCGAKSWTDPKIVCEQIHPFTRYRRYGWTAPDGSELKVGVEAKVAYADLTIENDIVEPRAAMKYLKDHQGRCEGSPFGREGSPFFLDTPEKRARYADYAALPALARVRATFRFQPNGARVVTREIAFDAPARGVDSLEAMYCWNPRMEAWTNLVFYAPRCKPREFRFFDRPGSAVVDLMAAKPFDADWALNDHLEKRDCTDPENMPDRFVRVGGLPGRRLGVVLGYSLCDGITAVANKGRERPFAYYYWKGGKMYPIAYMIPEVQPGRTVRCVSYTQYFDPEAEPDATAFYHHAEGDSEIVYFDTHRTLKGKRLKLPVELAGRKIAVLEKTPSVTLRTAGRVPANGEIVLDVADNYGTLVLKLDPK